MSGLRVKLKSTLFKWENQNYYVAAVEKAKRIAVSVFSHEPTSVPTEAPQMKCSVSDINIHCQSTCSCSCCQEPEMIEGRRNGLWTFRRILHSAGPSRQHTTSHTSSPSSCWHIFYRSQWKSQGALRRRCHCDEQQRATPLNFGQTRTEASGATTGPKYMLMNK